MRLNELTSTVRCSADLPFLKFASPGSPLLAMYIFLILFNDVTYFDAKRKSNRIVETLLLISREIISCECLLGTLAVDF